MCNRPSGMRPEAQLSDRMNWYASLYDKNVCEDIQHTHANISRALDIGDSTGFSDIASHRNVRVKKIMLHQINKALSAL